MYLAVSKKLSAGASIRSIGVFCNVNITAARDKFHLQGALIIYFKSYSLGCVVKTKYLILSRLASSHSPASADLNSKGKRSIKGIISF